MNSSFQEEALISKKTYSIVTRSAGILLILINFIGFVTLKISSPALNSLLISLAAAILFLVAFLSYHQQEDMPTAICLVSGALATAVAIVIAFS